METEEKDENSWMSQSALHHRVEGIIGSTDRWREKWRPKVYPLVVSDAGQRRCCHVVEIVARVVIRGMMMRNPRGQSWRL